MIIDFIKDRANPEKNAYFRQYNSTRQTVEKMEKQRVKKEKEEINSLAYRFKKIKV
jgi:hypothetical protein